MGHVIFGLDTQMFIKISNVYRNLKDQMKLDLCICEAPSYMHVTIETTFVGMAIIGYRTRAVLRVWSVDTTTPRRITTKEASHLNTTDPDTAERRTAAMSLFENSSSTKGKWQKRHRSLPLRGAGPKRKCGRCATVCSQSICV